MNTNKYKATERAKEEGKRYKKWKKVKGKK